MSDVPMGNEEKQNTLVEENGEREIDLLELFYKLIENMKYIILAAVLGAILAAGYVFFLATPMYEATSKLYVMSNNDSAINLSDLQIGTYLTNDYQEVFKTWEVHEMVIRNLGLKYSYAQMRGMLTISNPSNTRIITITVKNADPKAAQLIANEYASVARTYISEKMAAETPNILSNALLPDKPVSPQKARTLVLGFLLGALLAIGIVVLRAVVDDKLKNADDIRKYIGLPTLAVIPVTRGGEVQEKTKQRRRREE